MARHEECFFSPTHFRHKWRKHQENMMSNSSNSSKHQQQLSSSKKLTVTALDWMFVDSKNIFESGI
jgi:hypothetical protein